VATTVFSTLVEPNYRSHISGTKPPAEALGLIVKSRDEVGFQQLSKDYFSSSMLDRNQRKAQQVVQVGSALSFIERLHEPRERFNMDGFGNVQAQFLDLLAEHLTAQIVDTESQ
jgi:hypothetical protein